MSEVREAVRDLREHGVARLTLGQYLRPTPRHAPVERYWTPKEFDDLRAEAEARGFLMVSSSPLTRSSYHADEGFERLRARRGERV